MLIYSGNEESLVGGPRNAATLENSSMNTKDRFHSLSLLYYITLRKTRGYARQKSFSDLNGPPIAFTFHF